MYLFCRKKINFNFFQLISFLRDFTYLSFSDLGAFMARNCHQIKKNVFIIFLFEKKGVSCMTFIRKIKNTANFYKFMKKYSEHRRYLSLANR